MSNDVNLRTFPVSKNEALTMLYLQNKDLSDVNPEELAKMYDETYFRIRESLNALAKERRSAL